MTSPPQRPLFSIAGRLLCQFVRCVQQTIEKGFKVHIIDLDEIAALKGPNTFIDHRPEAFEFCLIPFCCHSWPCHFSSARILSIHPIHRDRITRGGSAGRVGAGAPLAGAAPMASASSFSRKPMLMRPCKAAMA